SLRVPLEAWRNTDESKKEDLVLRHFELCLSHFILSPNTIFLELCYIYGGSPINTALKAFSWESLMSLINVGFLVPK
ncbi:hypothetical protein FRX31_008362, partial [Thalictrum thalictroides]